MPEENSTAQSAGQSPNISTPSSSTNTAATTNAPSKVDVAGNAQTNLVEAPKEKVLTQTEVNELVGKVKHETAEKAKREAFAELQKSMAQQVPQYQQPYTQPGMAPPQGQMPQPGQFDPNLLEAMKYTVASLANDAIIQQQGQNVLNKITLAKQKYADFDDVTKLIAQTKGITNEHVEVFNSIDNFDDVYYAMGKDPEKFVRILDYTNKNKDIAKMEILKLSQSVRQNQEAMNQPKAPEPLQQVSPSVTRADTGKMTVSDLRRSKNLKA